MPTGDDRDTQATDAGIASDETVPQDPSQPTPQPPHVSTGPVIRVSRGPVAPERLGRYEIVRRLGRGGMGAVFEANDPELGRSVAIKVLRDDRDHPDFTESLRREAQALAKLVHPNVVTVYDVGVDEGRLFVVMQLVEGESIDLWLRDRAAKPAEIVAAFREAGKGLAAAHAKALVHCDFKPSNVLVDRDGAVRVGDFGLARFGAESANSVAGTPAYMPPEQFTGTATAASDQYAFCASLWEVLAGAQPFTESKIGDAEAARARVVPAMPRAAHVPAYVVRALARGLASDPAARFPSMDALLAALAPRRRGWMIASAAAVLVVVGAAAAAFALRPGARAERIPGEPDLAAVHALTHYGTTACAYAPAIDGDRLVFDRTQGDAVDLYEMPLAGGTPRQLTSAPTWEWRSNPGRHPGEVIHLISDPNDITKSGIAYLDLETTTDTRIANQPASDAVVTKRGIIYAFGDRAELRSIVGTQDSLFATAPAGTRFNQLAVSHAGERVAAVAYASKASQICVYDAVTAQPECFRAHAAMARAAFGGDDRDLYYASLNGIHRHDLQTGADTLVVPGAFAEAGLAVSADGKSLVYSDCGTRSQIVDLTTGAVLVDDRHASMPALSHNVLAWVRSEIASVVVARDATGREIQMTQPGFGLIEWVALDPSGTHVVFQSGAPHAGIYVAPLRRGGDDDLVRISDDHHDRTPVWLGDGLIAFQRRDDQGVESVYVANSDGGMLHKLPLGTRRVLGGTSKRALLASADHLYWYDLARGVEEPGPDVPIKGLQELLLSPNARWLLMRSGAEGLQLQRVLLDPPGKPEPVSGIKLGQTSVGMTIDDNGHVIAAPQTWSGDIEEVPAKPGAPF